MIDDNHRPTKIRKISLKDLKHNIYFDHAATTYMHKEVVASMLDHANLPLNASSVHSFGRKAKMILESARKTIASSVEADDDYRLIFTSSCTESNNIALHHGNKYRSITTAVEHPSALEVVGEGIIPVDKNGVVMLDVLDRMLYLHRHQNDIDPERRLLVSVMLANNETGVIQPLEEIASIVRKHKMLLHTDSTQAIGKIPVSVAALKPDIMTFSSHKCGGPHGSSALIYRSDLELEPLLSGGGQEKKIRPGTENIISIHGFSVAMSNEIMKRSLSGFAEVKKIRDYIEKSIKAAKADAIIFGEEAERLPNISSIGMLGAESQKQVIFFDMNGIALSSGSACSSGRMHIPRVHMSMGYDEDIAESAIRISLGLNNTMQEAETFVEKWIELANRTSKV